MIPLHTERLQLRLPTANDIDAIYTLLSDPSIAANMLDLPHPYQRSNAQAFVRYAQQATRAQTENIYVIETRATATVIGSISLDKRSFNIAEIGYWMGKPYRSQGYTTEAVRRIIRFGFAELGLNRIQAYFFAHNTASRRVLEKAGMQYEGVLREHFRKGDDYMSVGICAVLCGPPPVNDYAP